ncbi:MAG: hypothetical protein FIA95_00265 [Gemmatimonadetes bacterium]|nr:hypothetical protein [Gemmatimonadota bacterium]
MQLETFRGRELHEVIRQVRHALGDDAMIVRTHARRGAGAGSVEVVAVRAEEVEALRAKLDGARAAGSRARTRTRTGPYVVAMVGPAGAGKTAAVMRVALELAARAGRKVGLITLDTHRVGALEEIQTYSEIAGLPAEVAYGVDDAREALARLRDRDMVVVDTPGRGFGRGSCGWVEILAALDPDETHLVVPVGLRPEVARSLLSAIPGLSATHVLFSKLDEAPSGAALMEMVEALDLPSRWVSDSPDIPHGLGPAEGRILAAVGISAADAAPRRRHAG